MVMEDGIRQFKLAVTQVKHLQALLLIWHAGGKDRVPRTQDKLDSHDPWKTLGKIWSWNLPL